jgi:hypothetical protein
MLPVTFLDSDEQGTKFAQALRTGLYQADPQRILQAGSYVELKGAEVEDLIPAEIVVKAVDRMIREPEKTFEERYDSTKPIIPQVETWATEGGATLEKGWKVELAKRVKRALLDSTTVPPETLANWARIFEHFQVGELLT